MSMLRGPGEAATTPGGASTPASDAASAILPSPALDVDKPEPDVDGWRGWVVVAAASCSLFVYMGVVYSWGILQAEIARSTSCSLTSLTFVGSLATSFMASISIFVGVMIRKYGYRNTALAGALLLGLGELLSSCVIGRIGALFVTHGILFGVGGGLTILPCSTAPLKWFSEHRGLATGVVFGGGSLGAAVMGVATNQLIPKIGINWTFRVLGIMLWVVCVPAACCIRQPAYSASSPIPSLQWHRWRSPEFIIMLVGSAVATFPLFVPPYFIPIFARSVSDCQSAGIITLSVWNVASTVGRVFAGLAADSFLGPINSLLLSLLLCGVSALAVWPFASTLGLLALFAVINGAGCGAFFSLFPTTLGAVFGPQNTMAVLPIMWTSWFFGFFFGTPIASLLYSASGKGHGPSQYKSAAYYSGAMSMAGMAFFIVLRTIRTRKIFARV